MLHHFYLDPLHSEIRFPNLFSDFEGLKLNSYEYGNAAYTDQFDAAFDMLLNNGRYGSASRERLNAYRQMMRVDAYNNASQGERDARSGFMPLIITAETPVSFDEDAEVRTGGTLAIALMLPSPEGWQVMMTVAHPVRKRGIGAMMLSTIGGATNALVYSWVNRANSDAMCFLADHGWAPTGVDNNGNSRWTMSAGSNRHTW